MLMYMANIIMLPSTS